MDAETVWQTMLEVLDNGKYSLDAEDLFSKEILNCDDMSEEDKSNLISCLVSVKKLNGSEKEQGYEEIAGLLMKSPIWAKYFSEFITDED